MIHVRRGVLYYDVSREWNRVLQFAFNSEIDSNCPLHIFSAQKQTYCPLFQSLI